VSFIFVDVGAVKLKSVRMIEKILLTSRRNAFGSTYFTDGRAAWSSFKTLLSTDYAADFLIVIGQDYK